MEPATVRAWPSCSHLGASLRSTLGSRWVQSLFPLSRSIQRAVLGSHAGAMAAPWKEERDIREGKSVGWEKGEGDKPAPQGRG